MPIQIGDILGDYQVTGVLGRGGMGKVFRVRSLLTDREEAMKVVLPELDEDPGLADHFLREIKVHASLQHPHICQLRAALHAAGRLVMIVELVEGESLEDKLRAGPMDPAAAVRMAVEVLSALGYAHERGVIHRDVKPANILLASVGGAKLTDFGIAQSERTSRLTGTGLAVGTLAYMSPEQIRAKPLDRRSDLYSFGLTLYEMVTGQRAVRAESQHEMIAAQLEELPPEPVKVNPQVPAAISAAIMRAVQKVPALRFQSAAEFQMALGETDVNAWLASVPSPAAAPGQFDPVALERVTHALASYLGPIAKVLVSRTSRTSRGPEELLQALAAEIPAAHDRQKFLATARSAF